MSDLPPLPPPWMYVYVWRTQSGAFHRSFSASHYNGQPCDEQELAFTADQMHAYAHAAIAERDAEIDRLRADRSLLLNWMRRAVTAVAAAAELDADFDLDSQALDKLLTRFADDAARGKE